MRQATGLAYSPKPMFLAAHLHVYVDFILNQAAGSFVVSIKYL